MVQSEKWKRGMDMSTQLVWLQINHGENKNAQLVNTHSLCVFQIVVSPNGNVWSDCFDMVSHNLSVASSSSISLCKFIHLTNLFVSHLSAFSTFYQCTFLPFYQTRETRSFRVWCVTNQDPKVLLIRSVIIIIIIVIGKCQLLETNDFGC